MSEHEHWRELSRKLDWTFSYVQEQEIYPKDMSGSPWLPLSAWKKWQEPFQTSYTEYILQQHEKEQQLQILRQSLGARQHVLLAREPSWNSGLKLHHALLPLAEFAASIGNLRAGRFGRDSAWRTMSVLGALDECRHSQIPLLLAHDAVPWDRQYDWAHKFYHTNNWVSVAARHFFDELLLGANPIEFAIGTHFVLETGLTNVQFLGLSELADRVNDPLIKTMFLSIQTDEARHAQIGQAVLKIVCEHDRKYAQYLCNYPAP